MFYDHDILTSRKHGVATIWLVATLGSRSHLKKVTRKAILDVKITEACQTIITPEAPMALRLQGSLLYGVSRVFSQQCGYILTDAQSLHEKMRGVTTMMKTSHIDPNVGATKPEQLNLQEDPNFNINFDVSFDLAAFGLHDQSNDSSLSSPQNPHSSQSSLPIQELEENPFALPDPNTSDHAFDYFDLGQGIGMSSVVRSTIYGRPGSLASEPAVYDNSDFQVNADGDIMILGEGEPVLSASQIVGTSLAGMLVSEAVVAGDRVIVDLAEPSYQEFPNLDLDINDDYQPGVFEEDSMVTTQQTSPRSISQEQRTSQAVLSHVERSTEITVEALQGRNKPDALKIELDTHTELSNRQLTEWSTKYLANMIASQEERVNRQSLAQAKRNAGFWVLDQGIGGVQVNFGEDMIPHPFSIFSGQTLLDSLIGKKTAVGTKRSLSPASRESQNGDENEAGRRVRYRSEEQLAGRGENASPHANQDGLPPLYDDFPESEVGRRRESSLKDRSSQMPWNLSSRHGSTKPYGSGLRGISSSIGGQDLADFGSPSGFVRRTSRLTSASPLIGRGRALSYADNVEQQEHTTLEGSGLGELGDVDFQLAGEISEDFQLHGPAAAVSTQTAAQNQWIAATLEREAYNFLEFLRTSIQEKERHYDDIEDDPVLARTTTYQQLLPPAINSRIVGAQGLLHVLSLATKGLIEVDQSFAYGDIVLGVVGSVVPSSDPEKPINLQIQA